MKLKYLLFTFIISLIYISPTYAESCDSDDIARLKNLANHVDISYSVMEPFTTKEYGTTITYKDEYKLKISNINEEIYVLYTNKYNEKTTFEYDQNKGNNQIYLEYVAPGKSTITLYSTQCKIALRNDTIYLLHYNEYYNDEKCKNLQNKIDVCKEWTKDYITENKLQKGQ